MASNMRCTKMHQNGPRCTKMFSIAWQSKVFQICPEWLIRSISGPHDPSMTCSDFYPLLSVHLIKKWIILVTQDKFKTLCSIMLWWLFWCNWLRFSAPHVWPNDPSMTYSDFYPLLSVYLIKNWIILVTQEKFEILCSVMLWWPFCCILVHFGAFWCPSCATPWPLHDLLWLLYPSKCPFIREMDLISHSGQIQNALLSLGTVTILMHFGSFWSIMVHFVS